MENEAYKKPFRWTWQQFFIAVIIVGVIVLLVLWLATIHSSVPIQSNLIRNL